MGKRDENASADQKSLKMKLSEHLVSLKASLCHHLTCHCLTEVCTVWMGIQMVSGIDMVDDRSRKRVAGWGVN